MPHLPELVYYQEKMLLDVDIICECYSPLETLNFVVIKDSKLKKISGNEPEGYGKYEDKSWREVPNS